MSDRDSSGREHVWLHVTAGRGPAECQLAVRHLTEVIVREAEAASLAAVVIDAVAGEERGTLLSALVSLAGEGARAFAGRQAGSVKWVAPSPFRPHHKRKNWFAGIEVLDPPDLGDRGAIKASDVVLEAMRASGPGGQHVNKTESAVRATHRPTGLVATAREERSQAMNKKLALARLAAALRSRAAEAAAGADRDRWTHHDALERGRPVRTFTGAAFREREQ